MNNNYNFHLSEKLGKKSIFFSDTLALYDIDDNVYDYLKEYKNNRNEEILPEILKEFILNNSIMKKQNKELKHEIETKILILNISQNCNMDCIYCFGNGGTYGNEGFMNFETAKAAILKFFENSLEEKQITFFGGEPLLNYKLIKDVVEWIDKNYNEKPIYSITTNGTLMNEKIAEFLKNNDFYVTVSLDGTEKEQNELRPLKNKENSYKQIIETKKILEKYAVNFSFRGTLSSINSGILGMENIYYVPVVNDNEKMLPSIEDLDNILNSRLSDIIINNKFDDVPTNMQKYIKLLLNKQKTNRICKTGLESVTINTEGNIYYCHRYSENKDYLVGNVFNDSLEKIKNIIWKLYNDYTEPINNDMKCKACWAKNICGNGCLHEYYMSKKYTEKNVDIYCNISKLYIEYAFGLIANKNS